ncbi:hypothetical protein BS50DRAFT_344699 [Corynespora cassiicola Philippines]|uniref:Uncharacterized protein n=1 Tax=Corynespora cassiicola Philippines TaxID=1448308 RepID=A0A2T2N0N4_CORCC|nr:hypothetical protein BS50DRAFT_344699 [Corynespora cassiicola Philippines]
MTILLSRENREQLWKGPTETFEQRVSDIFCSLELVFEWQKKFYTTHMAEFVSFSFVDVAINEGKVRYSTQKEESGMGVWSKLTRGLEIPALFGFDFGELIDPENTEELCPSWSTVPTDKYYLAMRTSHLTEIMDRNATLDGELWHIVKDSCCWYISPQILRKCTCQQGSFETSCKREEVLHAKTDAVRNHYGIFTDIDELPQGGAVVFSWSSSRPNDQDLLGNESKGPILDQLSAISGNTENPIETQISTETLPSEITSLPIEDPVKQTIPTLNRQYIRSSQSSDMEEDGSNHGEFLKQECVGEHTPGYIPSSRSNISPDISPQPTRALSAVQMLFDSLVLSSVHAIASFLAASFYWRTVAFSMAAFWIYHRFMTPYIGRAKVFGYVFLILWWCFCYPWPWLKFL